MAVTTVTISGHVYAPDGSSPIVGKITARLSAPGTTSDGPETVVVAEEVAAVINADGTTTISLVPNDLIAPAGTTYRVTFDGLLPSGRRASWFERWQVPSGAALDLGSVPRVDVVSGVSYPAVLSTMQAPVDRRFPLLGMTSGGRPCAITRVNSSQLLAYRPLGGPYWLEHLLTTYGYANGPYSWFATRVLAKLAYTLCTSASCVYTGAGWQTYVTQDPNRYVGGTVKGNSTNGDYVTATVTGDGDLYVLYTARTAGGYARVDVNGSTDNANALPSNGTYRYIDTYSATDLVSRSLVKVATGLPYGTHTVVITVTNQHNPASSGYLVYFEAVAMGGVNTGLPSQTSTRPRPWVSGQTYAQYEQIQYLGNNYSNSTPGSTVAGATPPTHTTGTQSDGNISWLHMASCSYDIAEQYIQAQGSQLEYAYETRPTGATSYQYTGGVTHGNETLTALSLDVDGQAFSDLGVGAWVTGFAVTVVQAINATHPQTGATVVSHNRLVHHFTPESVSVTHEHDWLVNASIRSFYAAMWPVISYDAGAQRYVFDWYWSPFSGRANAADYFGVAGNPMLPRTQDALMMVGGDILGPKGSGGVPSSTPGTKYVYAALLARLFTANGVDQTPLLVALQAMNVSGANPPVNGYSSAVMKLYMERVRTSSPVSVVAGDRWVSQSEYRVNLAADPSLNFP